MKITHKDLKEKQITIHIDSLDDLWTLSKIIAPLDKVKGLTQRKVKIGDGSERSAKVSIRIVTLTILVEKVQYDPARHQLRVLGTIADGPEDIPRGDHHSFGLTLNDEITITHDWKAYELEKLEAAQTQRTQSLVVFFDREEAIIGVYTKRGFSQKAHLQGHIQKKDGQQTESTFYKDLADLIVQQQIAQKTPYVFCCSQQFWQQYLRKELERHSEIMKTVRFHEIDDISDRNQITKSKEFQQLVVDPINAKITESFEQILTAISKDGNATYGSQQVKRAVEQGAVSTILVSNALLQKEREKNSTEIEELISLAESVKTQVHVVDEEVPFASKLDGLGGIAASLRYKFE